MRRTQHATTTKKMKTLRAKADTRTQLAKRKAAMLQASLNSLSKVRAGMSSKRTLSRRIASRLRPDKCQVRVSSLSRDADSLLQPQADATEIEVDNGIKSVWTSRIFRTKHNRIKESYVVTLIIMKFGKNSVFLRYFN